MKIVCAGEQKDSIIVHLEDNSQCSAMLAPNAAYTVNVIASTSDQQMGIIFAPLGIDIAVKTELVKDLYFSPVCVTVNCIGGGGSAASGNEDLMQVIKNRNSVSRTNYRAGKS